MSTKALSKSKVAKKGPTKKTIGTKTMGTPKTSAKTAKKSLVKKTTVTKTAGKTPAKTVKFPAASAKTAGRQKIDAGIIAYNNKLEPGDKKIGDLLAKEITQHLPGAENKVWHGHPVWFLEGNPIVGYSKQKPGMRLMFWSGAGFDEEGLNVRGEKFKDASVFYNNVSEISKTDLQRWLEKSAEIQWDYKNIVKNRGRLDRLK